jgi:glyoxylase-like metal-dependent hydrolase (beta-lactamase superfamily II)
MKIHRISVPTLLHWSVNVYLIEEDPLTLIDAGPRDDASLGALKAGLASLGHKLSDIKRIIISHAHADHYGLARVIVEESGATAYIHEWDAPAVSANTDYRAYRELLIAAGVPREVISRMEAGYEKFKGFAYPLDHVETLKDNDEILFEHESLSVVHTPGHTPGSICLVRTSNRRVRFGHGAENDNAKSGAQSRSDQREAPIPIPGRVPRFACAHSRARTDHIKGRPR